MSSAILQIRPMQLEDIAQVRTIDQLSFSMPWPESAYRYELSENKFSRCWVAELVTAEGSNKIAGMVVEWLIIDEAHIATIAVHPDQRGQGIGRALLITALENAIRLGMGQVTLEVREGNLVAQNLYRRFGFVEVGRRARYYRDNQEDALIMTVDCAVAAGILRTAEKSISG